MTSHRLHAVLMCGIWLATTCDPASGQTPAVTRLPVEVWRGAPDGRSTEFCLPLARGELSDVNLVRAVLGKGQELPIQVRVLSTWPQDKSLRVLWLSVPSCDSFAVEYGKTVQRKPPATTLTVEQQVDGAVVTTGPLRFRWRERSTYRPGRQRSSSRTPARCTRPCAFAGSWRPKARRTRRRRSASMSPIVSRPGPDLPRCPFSTCWRDLAASSC